MGELFAIGEALIDMIPEETGKEIKNTSAFRPQCGGAPANVCGAFSKLGGKSNLLTCLGDDPFGDKLMDNFLENQIGSSYIKRTDEANTALAFVTLMEDGNRDFSFYRKPSADMLLRPEDLEEKWFSNCDILHFCSVALVRDPMKSAHDKAIDYARANQAWISFDPNLRFPLWSDLEALRSTVLDYIPKADILKVSDEEIDFIANGVEGTTEDRIRSLFIGNVKMIIFTKGADGAEVYLKNGLHAYAPSEKVKAIDTTGAGDAFIGSFLYQLHRDGMRPQDILEDGDSVIEKLQVFLEKSNQYCGKSVQEIGAIASYPKNI